MSQIEKSESGRRGWRRPLWLTAAFASTLALGCATVAPSDPVWSESEVRIDDCPPGAAWTLSQDASFAGCLMPDETPNGAVVTYYETGDRESYTEYAMGTPSGWVAKWHENGQLQSTGFMLGGHSTGVWRWWFENGQLERTTRFAVDGIPHGPHEEFYEDGRPKRIGRWDRGSPVGEWRAWNEEGSQLFNTRPCEGNRDLGLCRR